MAVRGGYIVIGADDNGRPVPPGVSVNLGQLYDESRLRPKLLRWLPEPLQIMTAVHELDGCRFVIVYVAPKSDGFCVLEKDGIHDDGGKQKFVFRKGEVYARHGTSSERWNQGDIADIWERVVAARKEQWRSELREDLADLTAAEDDLTHAGVRQQALNRRLAATRRPSSSSDEGTTSRCGTSSTAPQRHRYGSPFSRLSVGAASCRYLVHGSLTSRRAARVGHPTAPLVPAPTAPRRLHRDPRCRHRRHRPFRHLRQRSG